MSATTSQARRRDWRRGLAAFWMTLCVTLVAAAAPAAQTPPSSQPPAATSAQDTAAQSGAAAGAAPASQIIFERRSGAQDLAPLTNNDLGARPPPYGADIFNGTPLSPTGADVLDPGYVIKPGDHIVMTFFGLINQTVDAVVDPKGNVVVPNVGPVPIAGVPAGRVNSVIKAAAEAVFQSGVQVYASAANSSPIQVLVTGAVRHPGQYAGMSADSLVAYLQRAGGIDDNRGSYRRIQVLRAGAVLIDADLYDFLAHGHLPSMSFRNGDVVVVDPQGPVVSVAGAARAAFTFELAATPAQGAEILAFARPRPEATHAGVAGIRAGRPYNVYVPLADFAKLPLEDGDRVSFQADAPSDTLVIRVAGAHLGPSFFTVARGTSLAEMMAKITFDPQADMRSVFLRRLSVAAAQKQALDETLGRLQRALFVASTVPSTNGSQLANEAAATQQYVQDARNFQPPGDVPLPPGSELTRVLLEQGDTIVIPFKSDIVTVGGEVVAPQAVLFHPGAAARYYVTRAGGFSDIADRGKVLVIHPNGAFELSGRVQPGDRVQVLPRVFSRTLAIAQVFSQILYQVGIAAVAFRGL